MGFNASIALAIVALLDVLDGISTAIGLHFGVLLEMNPLMAWAWAVSPLLFVGIKILSALTVVVLASRVRVVHPVIMFWISGVLGIYLSVLVGHTLGWIAILS